MRVEIPERDWKSYTAEQEENQQETDGKTKPPKVIEKSRTDHSSNSSVPFASSFSQVSTGL